MCGAVCAIVIIRVDGDHFGDSIAVFLTTQDLSAEAVRDCVIYCSDGRAAIEAVKFGHVFDVHVNALPALRFFIRSLDAQIIRISPTRKRSITKLRSCCLKPSVLPDYEPKVNQSTTNHSSGQFQARTSYR